MKKIITLLVAVLCLFSLCGCGEKKDEKTISVACSPTPHAEILGKAKEILAEQGWSLEIVEYEDYVQPINVVEDGDIDANYFAHVPYIDNFNAENNTNQVVVAKVHYEPFGIYPGKKASLADLADGDDVIIPNDGSNETRALLLLQDNGIIKLPDGTGADSLVTKNDLSVQVHPDDEYAEKFIKIVPTDVKLITYGIKKQADIMAKNIEFSIHGVVFNCETFKGNTTLNLQLNGMFSVYNSLAAICVAKKLGIPLQ